MGDEPPVIEKVRHPMQTGKAESDLYRSSSKGRYPGILVCLEVVPFGVEYHWAAVMGYTEMQFFHLDALKGRLPLPRLPRELGKFFGAAHPIFRQTAP
ncbi:MAG TPA: hypothetical protein VLH85_01670 [Levilinea sp.]|nr:hypothetical protein [Levilinea sp.]